MLFRSSLGGHTPDPAPPAPDLPEGGDSNMLFVTNKEGKTAAFIRVDTRLFIRGFNQGAPGPAALISSDCDPTNLDLEEVGYNVVYAVGKDGALVQCGPGPFGPVVKVV